MAYNLSMRPRVAAVIVSLLAVLLLGGWLLKRRADANQREHAAALARASREPGVVVVDPVLSPGVLEVELIPAGPSIELSVPATILVGREGLRWSPGGRTRFQDMAGKRDQRVSVIGEYLVEGPSLDIPQGGSGARVALRAIPIDASSVGPPFEKQLEILTTDPSDFLLVWKQSTVVVAESKVPRAGGRDALAARVEVEWKQMGSHRDPADRKLDRAVIRAPSGALFYEIFPLVDAILATKRSMILGGEGRVIPAFDVSVQPAITSPARRYDDLDGAPHRDPRVDEGR